MDDASMKDWVAMVSGGGGALLLGWLARSIAQLVSKSLAVLGKAEAWLDSAPARAQLDRDHQRAEESHLSAIRAAFTEPDAQDAPGRNGHRRVH